MILLVRHWKLLAAFVLLVAVFVAGWTANGWRYQTKISDMQKQSEIAATAMSEKYREVEIARQEVVNELANQQASHAMAQAKEREKIAVAVAHYAAEHHLSTGDATAVCSRADADWLRILTQAIRGTAAPAGAAGRPDAAD